MDKAYRELIESIMKLVAAEFGSNCEIVLHDWSNEYDKTIVAIENGHVSGRKVGGCGSNNGLEVMRGTSDGSQQMNYLTRTADGRILRSSSLYLKDEAGNAIGALCINYDLSDLLAAQKTLSALTMAQVGFPDPGSRKEQTEHFTNDVNELLDILIEESVRGTEKAPSEMTREEKKQAIDYLDRKGALLITRSGDKICKFFGISKYTLYSYLEEIHREMEAASEKE